MRTGEIVDLANERRLSAMLDFTASGGELLILNGGSRAEELAVVTTVGGLSRSERRAAYCIDSGTSMQLLIPIGAGKSAGDVTVRIIGGHGEMLLAPPARAKPPRIASVRGWSALAVATLLLLMAGGRLDAPTVSASADPEPAPADAPLVKANVSLHVPAQLPSVSMDAHLAARHKSVPANLAFTHVARTAEHRTMLTAMAMPPAPELKRSDRPQAPAPKMTDLRVPSTAKSGDFVPVAFGAVARQVKIVASIGPTIVSKTIIGAQHGVIAIRSPKSDLDSRVMTVRAYAQDGNRTSTLQAMVILVRP